MARSVLTIPLFEIKEGVGKVDDVLMAVDVGHGGESGVEEEVQVEEYRQKTMKTTKAKPQAIYIKFWPLIKSPISVRSFRTPIFPSNPQP